MTPQADQISRYNLYRKRGMELNNKLLRSIDSDLISEAAEELGLVRKGSIEFESEEEADVLMDFALHEYREDGKTAVGRYRESPGGEDEIERELLDGLASSYTSLFQISSASRESRTVDLEDLLGDRGRVQIIDNSLSLAPAKRTLLFLRIVPLRGFNMTSGVSFFFPEEDRNRMMRAYDNLYERLKTDSEATRRYVAFFRANRIFGKKGMYI